MQLKATWLNRLCSMNFGYRFLEESDYSVLVEWWNWFRFPVPPQDCLPDNGRSGIMVSIDGIDVCAGFLYATNSKLSWIEFVVSNPDYKDKNRKEAIKQCIYGLTVLAKNNGFTAVFSSVKKEYLIPYYEEVGFIKSSATELILKL